jgi:hypothetical protein
MPYVQVELDALKVCPDVARVTGLSDLVVTGGLVRMWAYCWEAKTETLRPLQLAALFGCRDAAMLAESLEAFGFLEAMDGGYRVKGAQRYLRLDDGRSKGGKAAAGNLIPGARQKARKQAAEFSAAAESQPRASREAAERSSRLSSALTPNTEHQTPKLPKPPTPKAQTPHSTPLVERVVEVFEAERGAKYSPTFADEHAGRALLGKASEDEVLRRWAIGLRARYPACNGLPDLLRNWNAYATEAANGPPSGAKAVSLVRTFGAEKCAQEGCERPYGRDSYGVPMCEEHAAESDRHWRGVAQ